MRLLMAVSLVAATIVPASAQNELPEGVDQLMTCAHVYSLKSEDAAAAGDEGAKTEFFHVGDALLGQAKLTLESAGYSADEIENVDMNYALTTGFNYGASMGEEMLADCLAAADTP